MADRWPSPVSGTRLPEWFRGPLGQVRGEKTAPVGQIQHTPDCCQAASGCQSSWKARRGCLRKGCGREFQPRRWNQRYCQDPSCLRLVRRWQAAKRQQRRRQSAEHRQQHRDAQRQFRQRAREKKKTLQPTAAAGSPAHSAVPMPTPVCVRRRAWSRSNGTTPSFCDRPGCYDAVRASSRWLTRYCGDECAQAMRRVLDRERKWLRRKTSVGRLKRRLEYQAAREKRAGQCGRQSAALTGRAASRPVRGP